MSIASEPSERRGADVVARGGGHRLRRVEGPVASTPAATARRDPALPPASRRARRRGRVARRGAVRPRNRAARARTRRGGRRARRQPRRRRPLSDAASRARPRRTNSTPTWSGSQCSSRSRDCMSENGPLAQLEPRRVRRRGASSCGPRSAGSRGSRSHPGGREGRHPRRVPRSVRAVRTAIERVEITIVTP